MSTKKTNLGLLLILILLDLIFIMGILFGPIQQAAYPPIPGEKITFKFTSLKAIFLIALISISIIIFLKWVRQEIEPKILNILQKKGHLNVYQITNFLSGSYGYIGIQENSVKGILEKMTKEKKVTRKGNSFYLSGQQVSKIFK
jgi:hypothetical protein